MVLGPRIPGFPGQIPRRWTTFRGVDFDPPGGPNFGISGPPGPLFGQFPGKCGPEKVGQTLNPTFGQLFLPTLTSSNHHPLPIALLLRITAVFPLDSLLL